MTVMPKTNNDVRPWFTSLDPDFSDKFSFDHQIEKVRNEIEEVCAVASDLVAAGYTEVHQELIDARALLIQLKARRKQNVRA